LTRKGSGQDFGMEAIETLLKMMEDHRDDLVVIVAGYTGEMDTFLQANPGLSSRFNRFIRFADYVPAELLKILLNLMAEHSYALSEATHPGLLSIFEREIQAQRERFGNARYVRNIFEKMMEAQAQRVYALANASVWDLQNILQVDVELALGEPLCATSGRGSNTAEVMTQLNRLVGLVAVKKQISRLLDFVHMQQAREKAGFKVAHGFSQHLVFTGNPGTGKTVVARIVAELYFSLGLIPSKRILEVDRSMLVAGYVGQSAIKTREAVERARGGILFIDEAYALAPGDAENDFGREVIDTLLKAMEDYRDDLVVVVAGYTAPMTAFIESNPGLRSRFNHFISFDDYQAEELVGIFESFCQTSEYVLDAGGREYLTGTLQHMVEAGKTNANGRFVRNVYERCIEVQSARLSQPDTPVALDMNALTVPDLADATREITDEQETLRGTGGAGGVAGAAYADAPIPANRSTHHDFANLN
jgi:SpoVK/Ycf46/Vps4 family AAA+-type ATPase